MQQAVFLVMVNIPEEDWSYAIEGQRKIIGRSSKSQIRIPDQYERISRRHAEVWCDKSQIWVNDLGSRGGTQVNGVWLKKDRPANVVVGDRVSLAGVELKVVDHVSKLAEVMVVAGIVPHLVPAPESESVTTIYLQQPQIVARSKLATLTPAELDLVLWMCRGYSTDDDLGAKMFRSPHTVRTQIASIFGKLELHSRAEIMSWLMRASNATLPTGKDSVGAGTVVEMDQVPTPPKARPKRDK